MDESVRILRDVAYELLVGRPPFLGTTVLTPSGGVTALESKASPRGGGRRRGLLAGSVVLLATAVPMDLSNVVEPVPTSDVTQFLRAEFLLGGLRGDLMAAFQAARAGADSEDGSEVGRFDRARTLYLAGYLAGNLTGAKALFERLQTTSPDDMDYLGYLGVIAAREGTTDRSRKCYDRRGRPSGHPYPSCRRNHEIQELWGPFSLTFPVHP